MKKTLQLAFSFAFFISGFSQNLKPIPQKVNESKNAKKTFVKYNFFDEVRINNGNNTYRNSADDVTVMKLNKSEINRINEEKPEALEMSFPFEGKTLTLELLRNNFFTNDFRVNTDKGNFSYNKGTYYQGIVGNDNESLVAVSFFNDEIIGVASIKSVGNIIVGKAKNSENYISYNDQKLKGENPFVCGADQLIENQKNMPVYDPAYSKTSKKTDNCVRIYYEAGYGPYTQNGSNVTSTVNWVTAMHNNISTLYANDGITVALSEVFVWTTTDPFSGSPSQILNQFRNYRTTFNGDVAQLLRNPATTSIAWVDALCSTYKYSYSGVNSFYNDVPTYSWNIEAMTHEIGHNLGSPHTHACAWNGNNTAIDGCGPAYSSSTNEGCNAPLPTNGGTIMSYCHLVQSVGINFANGFGEQPGALIRSRINASGCLGINCVTSCQSTITAISMSSVSANSATVTFTDNVSTSWKYRLSKMDGTIISSGNTNSKILNFSGLEPATYYRVFVGTDCSGPDAFTVKQLFLTDADWCSGILFTDNGGSTNNYTNNETIIKTFYPTNPNDKLKLTFTEFDTEAGYDFMNIYDGPTVSSPRFSGGTQLSGTTIPGPFISTHSTGAITVRFVADPAETGSGWKASFECVTLATVESNLLGETSISKTSVKGLFKIISKEKITFYEVFDASGKLIKNSGKINDFTVNLDLSNHPVGNYVIKITSLKGSVSKKVIR